MERTFLSHSEQTITMCHVADKPAIAEDLDINTEDVKTMSKEMMNGKAVGVTSVTAKMLKAEETE